MPYDSAVQSALTMTRTRANRVRFAKFRQKITQHLTDVAAASPDYWDFRQKGGEIVSRNLFQYPAMMVPALQKELVAAILRIRPGIKTIADPFVGSGTILVLSMMNGRAFVGQDINPLAILVAKTRAYSLDYERLQESVDEVNSKVQQDHNRTPQVRFVGQSKWFTFGASVAFTKLRRAIRRQACVDTRRFLWVCLAECVRLNSNSRTSTFKLHVKPRYQQIASDVEVVRVFSAITVRNLLIVKEFADALRAEGLVNDRGIYVRPIRIIYGDTSKSLPPVDWERDGKCPLTITSPPYGDNHTTVPYGQAAWLPLQWIDVVDIDANIPKDVAKHAFDIDNRSIGGTRNRTVFGDRKNFLAKQGGVLANYITMLESQRGDGLSRFVHFAHDLQACLEQIAGHSRGGANILLTLGHRNISGTTCPLTDICQQMLARNNVKEVIRIDRHIRSKRMAMKNQHSVTINHEYISILRKASSG